MEEKHEAHEVKLTERSRFWKWLDNFWFHYKWQTIGVLAVVILLAVTLPQCARGDDAGITVTFAGGYGMNNSEQAALKAAMAERAEAVRLTLGQYSIYTEDEITQRNTYPDPVTGEDKLDVAGKNADRGVNQDRIKTLQSYLMVGDCGIWIVSPYVYESFFEGRIQITADCRLGDTALYSENAELHFLSAELRVVLTRSVFGETAKDSEYEQIRQAYEALTAPASENGAANGAA